MTIQTTVPSTTDQHHHVTPAIIKSVRIRGFRSLADVDLMDLPMATVLIGANGSGKSNFIRFFEMLSWMLRSRRLEEFVERHGGADAQLFGGNSVTPRMEAEIRLRAGDVDNDYRFILSHGHPDRFIFTEEAFRYRYDHWENDGQWQYLDSGHREARIVEAAQSMAFPGVNTQTASIIVRLLRNCSVFQFHDTSDSSDIKKRWDVGENNRLRSDGGNLAAVLHQLEHSDVRRYEFICRQIGRILPGFDRFAIEESYGKVALRWKAKWTDKTFGAHLTSDGSLRFFALVTLLNLPSEMLPDVILLDEPELGLHPAAVTLVGSMIDSLATERQIILATQSPLLVDAFDLDAIFALDLHQGSTQFRKLGLDQYQIWLDEGLSSGDLWRRNFLGGRP